MVASQIQITTYDILLQIIVRYDKDEINLWINQVAGKRYF